MLKNNINDVTTDLTFSPPRPAPLITYCHNNAPYPSVKVTSQMSTSFTRLDLKNFEMAWYKYTYI